MLLFMGCAEELNRKIKVTHTFMYHMVSRNLTLLTLPLLRASQQRAGHHH
jgi:hypothetical protein